MGRAFIKSQNIDQFYEYYQTGIYFYNGWAQESDPDYVTGTLPFRNAQGLLFVGDNGTGGTFQILININTGTFYRRSYNNGSWNNWASSN
jgi:hypothetical protein